MITWARAPGARASASSEKRRNTAVTSAPSGAVSAAGRASNPAASGSQIAPRSASMRNCGNRASISAAGSHSYGTPHRSKVAIVARAASSSRRASHKIPVCCSSVGSVVA